MPISVSCSCGHRFRVDDAFEGQRGACPACSADVDFLGAKVPPFDVFISYSSKDKAIADAAVAVLERKDLRCWVAPRNIVPGQEWSEAIIEGIGSSRLLVLVYSGHSNSSQQVVREVERAVAKGIPIIPFRIEDVPASKAMEYFISHHHWLDAFHPPLEKHLEQLSDTVTRLLDGAPTPKPEEDHDLVGKVKAAVGMMFARDRRLHVMMGLSAVLLLAALVVAGAIFSHRPETASAEVIEAKSQAEVLANELGRLDPGQGFEQLMADFERQQRAAAALFDDKQFADSLLAYQDALTEGRKLQDLDRQRRLAAECRTSANQSRTGAEQASAETFANPLWREAIDSFAEADQAFETRDFASAAKKWREAAAKFATAATEAKNQGLPRIKALAYWTGLAIELHGTYESRRQTFSRSGAFASPPLGTRGVGSPAPSDWPPYQATVNLAVQMLAGDCQQGLGLDAQLVERYLAATDNGVRNPIAKQILAEIAARHGEPADKAYRLGANLALLKTLCAMGLEAGRNRGPWPAHASVIETTDYCLQRAHEAGCTEETILQLKNVRRAYDHCHDGFRRGSPVRAFEEMTDLMDELLANFSTMDEATAYFKDALPATPPPVQAPDPEVQAAVAALQIALTPDGRRKSEKSYGAFTFDVERSDRPPTRLAFAFDQGSAAQLSRESMFGFSSIVKLEVMLDDVLKLNTLQSLNLNGLSVTDQQLSRLKALPHLRELWLESAAITDAGISHLAAWRELVSLKVARTKITDTAVASLAELKTLETLDLSHTQTTDESVQHLKTLQRLKSLNLRNTSITAEGAAELKAALPTCKIDH